MHEALGDSAGDDRVEYSVELTATGLNKARIVKALQDLTEMSEREASDLVFSRPPVALLTGVDRATAEAARAALTAAGASVDIRSATGPRAPGGAPTQEIIEYGSARSPEQETDRPPLATVDGETRRIGADEMFCQSCGRVMLRAASICVGCGVAVRRVQATGTGLGEPKSKTTAVLLAIFVGFFTWLYTYREDSTKFWLTIGISIANFVLSILTLGLWLFIAFPASIGFWIWAIVDTATKSGEWYANY